MATDALYYGFSILFYLITLFFVIYSVSIAYHWYTYGEKKSISSLSLAIYLVGSAPLFMIMAFSLYMM
jgi:hypothetical protein